MVKPAPQINTPIGIAELAARYDVTPRTIRFYEDKGLLHPRRRAGARVFSKTDCDTLENVLRAKRLGFSLEDIKIVFDVSSGEISDASELRRHQTNFRHVIARLKHQRRETDVLIHELGDLCDRLDDDITLAANEAFVGAAAYQSALGQHLEDEELSAEPHSIPETENA